MSDFLHSFGRVIHHTITNIGAMAGYRWNNHPLNNKRKRFILFIQFDIEQVCFAHNALRPFGRKKRKEVLVWREWTLVIFRIVPNECWCQTVSVSMVLSQRFSASQDVEERQLAWSILVGVGFKIRVLCGDELDFRFPRRHIWRRTTEESAMLCFFQESVFASFF